MVAWSIPPDQVAAKENDKMLLEEPNLYRESFLPVGCPDDIQAVRDRSAVGTTVDSELLVT